MDLNALGHIVKIKGFVYIFLIAILLGHLDEFITIAKEGSEYRVSILVEIDNMSLTIGGAFELFASCIVGRDCFWFGISMMGG